MIDYPGCMAMNMKDGFQDRVELTRLLAKFKLSVRRQLDLSVNLERLQNEPDYAREQFATLEELIEDEELLVTLLTLLTLRERLVPRALSLPAAEPEPPALAAESLPTQARYRFGPRS